MESVKYPHVTEKPAKRDTIVHDPFIDGLETRPQDDERPAARRVRGRQASPRRRQSPRSDG